jgi:hypothetical protein
MAEQPHSSDEITGMSEKQNMQEMLKQIINSLEQNRKERKI